MSFQPLVPMSGFVGWTFLQRTLDQQQAAFDESAPVKRVTDNFRENIGNIETAEDLVNDRELLTVALGAFGLADDVDNKYFIQKILEEGTTDDAALANKLSDSRYAEFSRAFGFGDVATPPTKDATVAEDIISRYERQSFEEAVGEQDNQLRLALNLEKAIDDVATGYSSNNAQWYALLGNDPLREVVQTALGLPDEIASLDIDKQLETFQDRANSVLGSDDINDFLDSDLQDKLTRLYLVRAAAAEDTGYSSGSIALTLLGA